MRLDDRPDPMTGVSHDAATEGQRMVELGSSGTAETSPLTWRLIGWAIVLVIVGSFLATVAGWIDVVPA
jgi:hypothetical protein